MVQREKHPNGAGKHDDRSTRCKYPRFYAEAREKDGDTYEKKDPSQFPSRHRKIPKLAKVLQNSKDVNRSEIYQIK